MTGKNFSQYPPATLTGPNEDVLVPVWENGRNAYASLDRLQEALGGDGETGGGGGGASFTGYYDPTADATNSIVSRLTGKSVSSSTRNFFTTATHTGTPAYVRSTTCWASNIDGIEALGVWNSQYGTQVGFCAISPLLCIMGHSSTIANGTILRWVTSTNVIVERTLVSSLQVGSTDIRIGLLSSALPSTIAPMRILHPSAPVTLVGTPFLIMDQELKALAQTAGARSSNVVSTIAYVGFESWFEAWASGDNGRQWCLITSEGPILISHYQSSALGPDYALFIAGITAASATLASGSPPVFWNSDRTVDWAAVKNFPVFDTLEARQSAVSAESSARIFADNNESAARIAADKPLLHTILDATAHVTNAIVSRTEGLIASSTTKQIFAGGTGVGNSTRNASCWAASAPGLAGLGVWNSWLGTSIGFSAISPLLVAICHHAAIPDGTTLRWITADNVVVDRVLSSSVQVGISDLRIGLLSAALPSTIPPLPILGADAPIHVLDLPFLSIDLEMKAIVNKITDPSNNILLARPLAGRETWYEDGVSGDSGHPWCLLTDDGPVLISHYSTPDAGPDYRALTSAILSVSTGLAPTALPVIWKWRHTIDWASLKNPPPVTSVQVSHTYPDTNKGLNLFVNTAGFLEVRGRDLLNRPLRGLVPLTIITNEPTTTSSAMGLTLASTASKWVSGVYANGKIYCVGSSVNSFLVIDTVARTASLQSLGITLVASTSQFIGNGVLHNNKIYFAPFGNTSGFAVVDVLTGTASYQTFGVSMAGGGKWTFGAVCGDGNLYFAGGFGASYQFLKVDPVAGTAVTFDTGLRNVVGAVTAAFPVADPVTGRVFVYLQAAEREPYKMAVILANGTTAQFENAEVTTGGAPVTATAFSRACLAGRKIVWMPLQPAPWTPRAMILDLEDTTGTAYGTFSTVDMVGLPSYTGLSGYGYSATLGPDGRVWCGPFGAHSPDEAHFIWLDPETNEWGYTTAGLDLSGATTTYPRSMGMVLAPDSTLWAIPGSHNEIIQLKV